MRTLRDPERLRPWLMTVAANEARQLIRRRSRRAIVEIAIDPGGGRTATARVIPPKRLRRLPAPDRSLRRLSPEWKRTIVAMRYAVGLTSIEIGQAPEACLEAASEHGSHGCSSDFGRTSAMIDRPLGAVRAGREAGIAARVRAYTDRALVPTDAAVAIAHGVATRSSPPIPAFGGTALWRRRVAWLVLLGGLLVVTLAVVLLLAAGAIWAPERLAFARVGDLYVAATEWDRSDHDRARGIGADGSGLTPRSAGLGPCPPCGGSGGWSGATDNSVHPAKVEVLTADGRIG